MNIILNFFKKSLKGTLNKKENYDIFDESYPLWQVQAKKNSNKKCSHEVLNKNQLTFQNNKFGEHSSKCENQMKNPVEYLVGTHRASQRKK